MSDDKEIQIGGLELLPPPLRGAAREVQHFCGKDLNRADASSPVFNWANFYRRVDSRPNADLTIAADTNNTVVKHSANAGQVVDALISLLKQGLGIVLVDPEVESLKARIENCFTNVHRTTKGWLFRRIDKNNMSWQYSVLFALNGDEEGFVSFLSTFEITAAFTEKQFLGMTLYSSSNYAVEVQAVKLSVSKNFRSNVSEP